MVVETRSAEAPNKKSEGVKSDKIIGPETRKAALRHYQAGVRAGLDGRFGEAAESFQRSLALNPTDSNAYYGLGHAYFDLGRLTESLVPFREAIRLRPNDPEAFQMIGLAYARLGDYKMAVEAFRAAVLQRPTWVEARYNLGNAFYKLGQYSAAVGYYTEIVALKANDSAPFNDLGAAYGEMNRYGEAFQALKRAARLQPNSAAVHNNLGILHLRQNRYAEAIDAFKKARTLSPDDKIIHHNLELATAAAAANRQQSAQTSDASSTTDTSDASHDDRGQWLVRTTLDRTPDAPAPQQTTLTAMAPDAALPLTASTVAPALGDARPTSLGTRRTNAQPGAPVTTNSTKTTNETNETRTIKPIDAASNSSSSGSSAKNSDAASAPVGAAVVSPTSVYRVGVGDMLDIRLLNSSSTVSTLYTILAGGFLEYPQLDAPLMVSGLTTDEIDARLTTELERRAIVKDPEVVIGIREYASHVVLVSGLVNDPGSKVLRREAIPLYVVLADAQPKPEAGRVEVTSRHAGQAGQTKNIALSDQTAMNTLVYPGDVLNVSAMPPQFYYIGGNVTEPGQKQFHPNLTLTQTILAAGGRLQATANSSKNKGQTISAPTNKTEIHVTRQGADGRLTTTPYNLSEIMTGKIPDPIVQSDDRIEVGQ